MATLPHTSFPGDVSVRQRPEGTVAFRNGSIELMEGYMKNNRHTLKFSLVIAALFAFALPLMASGQGRYPDYGYPDYGRGGYDQRGLRDSIHRLDRLAKDFQRDLDRALDRSRNDGTRREDRINQEARQFRNAVGNLKSRFGNGRDLYSSRNEAARVMQEADQLERIARPRWFDGRLSSEWSQIRRELNTIERAYGLYGYDNRGGRNDDWGRGRRDRNDIPWWQRIPFPRN